MAMIHDMPPGPGWREALPGERGTVTDPISGIRYMPDPEAAVHMLRTRLWRHGWRPMPVLSWDHPDPITAGKAPIGKDWGKRARQNPPECIKLGAVVKHALNTGLLCDGLRVIDGDVEDHEIAGKIRLAATTMFGETIGRYRDNSARFALAYRAAEGSPAKRTIAGTSGKVEVLGHGQQFVAHGVHPSGAALWWSPTGPDETAVDDLPAVTEDAITVFLKAVAPLIGADPEQAEQRTNGLDHEPGEPQADALRIAAALLDIPNHGAPNWEAWNRVAMAVWRATGGSDMGWAALESWSHRNPAYDPKETRERWDHYPKSPPTKIGAGTIFHMAAEARRARANGPDQPPPPEDPRADVPPLESAPPMDTPAGGPPPVPPLPDPIDALLEEFNARFVVVNENGKAVIYQPTYDQVLKRRCFNRMSKGDLETLYMNRKVLIAKGQYKTVAKFWLSHPDRRQFVGGVMFDPGMRCAPDVLYLWEGFAIEPAPGDWSLLREHIETVVCGADTVRFNYLLRWIARMFQNPAKQGEVAVVMKGAKGSGKGTLAKALLRIAGHHGIAISQAKHLTGNFNSHLRDSVLLFADEAFFAGDRQHIGALNSLITEPYLTIEGKFANAYQAPNFLHVMMASNEEWVVPASLDERRYFVLNVSDARARDHAYFAAIWKQLEAGGYAGMLHDLLAVDLIDFNLRSVPNTDGLQDQRKLSLPVPERWWMDVLHRGYVFRSKLGLEAVFREWTAEVSTELLFTSYEEFARQAHERRPMSRETLGRFMLKLGCRPKRLFNAPVGEHITDVAGPFGGVARTAEVVSGHKPMGYVLGGLQLARAAFCKITGLAPAWQDEDDGA